MRATERRKYLLEKLKTKKRISVVEMAAELGVSGMSIRRDLHSMESQSIITLVHGGAVYNEGAIAEPSAMVRYRSMWDEKNNIGNYCAGLVHEGNSVFLDAGSTNMKIAEALVNRQNIAVMTHSLPIMNILSQAKGIQLFSLSGIYDATKQAFFGAMTRQQIQRFHIDITFLGVNAIDVEDGLMMPELPDIAIKQALLERSYKTIVVTDHTKIGKKSFIRLCDVSDIQQIVVDKEANEDFVKKLQRKGVEVTLV